MKKLYLSILAALLSCGVFAQSGELSVAVFDPSTAGASIDEGTKMAIREIISYTIVNEGDYKLVERGMLDQVMEEQAFSNSGVVDDSQATEIGKLAGANKVVLSVIIHTGNRHMISIKMIDVKTGSIEKHKVKKDVPKDELFDAIEPLTLSMLNAKQRVPEPPQTDQPKKKKSEPVRTEQADVQEEVAVPMIDPADLIPGPGEVIFYLPAGYKPKKAKDNDLPLIVKLDNEVIGSGTLSTGFLIRIPQPGEKYTLKIGEPRSGEQKIKIESSAFNFYEFQIYRWNSLGRALYGVSMKGRKNIK